MSKLKEDIQSDDLKKIRRRICAVEVNNNQFQENIIGQNNGKQTNFAIFTECSQVPKVFRLQKASTPIPKRYKIIWEGKMLVAGQEEDIIALRLSS